MDRFTREDLHRRISNTVRKYGNVGILISVIGFLFSIAIYIFTFPDSEESDTTALFWALLSTIVAVAFAIIGDIVARGQFEGLVKAELSAYKDAVRSRDVVCEGRANQVAAQMLDKLRHASTVKNTFVHFRGKGGYEDISEGVLEAYADFLSSSGAFWEDIFSTGKECDERIQRLETLMSETEFPGTYRYYLVHPLPIINFIMFGSERIEHLYFGWGHHENNPNGLVFYTRDQNLIDHFNSYFETLKSFAFTRSTEDVPAVSSFGPEGIEGRWVSVAFNLDDSFMDIALINIEYDRSSNAHRLNGSIFVPTAGRHSESGGEIHSEIAKLDGRKFMMIFRKESDDRPGTPLHGYSIYHFHDWRKGRLSRFTGTAYSNDIPAEFKVRGMRKDHLEEMMGEPIQTGSDQMAKIVECVRSVLAD